jgi:hypothetical protein
MERKKIARRFFMGKKLFKSASCAVGAAVFFMAILA